LLLLLLLPLPLLLGKPKASEAAEKLIAVAFGWERRASAQRKTPQKQGALEGAEKVLSCKCLLKVNALASPTNDSFGFFDCLISP